VSTLSQPQLDLVEALDRTLGAGAVVGGDLTLSLADVDLVHVSLRALIASVASLEQDGRLVTLVGTGGNAAPQRRSPARGEAGAVTALPPAPPAAARQLGGDPVEDRSERVEHGLIRLVLTVVELLRRLMERQALRRVEAGSLDEEQVDRLGRALERLEEQMAELKKRFDIADDDLALRLGPLPIDDMQSHDDGGHRWPH
jgi:hypothetical protein